MGRGHARHGHAEGRAADVVHVEGAAKCDGGGVAAVLAADAHRELGGDAPALLHCYSHQAADAVPVQLAEGIFLITFNLTVITKLFFKRLLS